MENYKNYYDYFMETSTYRQRTKLNNIKKILKAKKEELISLEDWEKSRLAEFLTDKQAKLLYSGDIKELKELLKKYKPKAEKELEDRKEEVKKMYNDIKELKDIKEATFEIVWSKNRGVYGYQCKCYSKIQYKNGTFNYYEGESTGGCGYDKSSSALSYNMNKTCKILLVKYGNKIIKDNDRHYNCYACENLYFSYGVGISSYITMFNYFGFKVQTIYHKNEDITIIIRK